MKIAIFSDLHNEFTPWLPPEYLKTADVIIFAGDIDTGTKGIPWILKHFKQPVIYVLGNHEYFGGDIQSIDKQITELTRDTNIYFLNNDAIKIGDIYFVGATLWTDFMLFNEPQISKDIASRKMYDYKTINFIEDGKLRRFTVKDSIELHKKSLLFFNQFLPKKSKTVVITHHAPSIKSVSPKFLDQLSAAFASNLDNLILSNSVELWVHGHTHHNVDYMIGETRIISNQRGYIPEEGCANFNTKLCIDI